MIYLDHAATTPLDGEVLKTYIEMLEEYGNPSSLHQMGKRAQKFLRQAREGIAGLFNVDDREVYFTSGATESNNWALISQSLSHREAFGQDEIIASSLEHPAVNKTLDYLEGLGFKVHFVDPRDGDIQVEDFLNKTTDRTCGWVCMAVNNETGSILPIEALGEEARDRKFYFHVDGVQGMALPSLDLRKIFFTSLTCSGHKLYGPKGQGFLMTKNLKRPLTPFHHGGGQEFGLRPGTVDVPGAVALCKTLEIAYKRAEEDAKDDEILRETCIEKLRNAGVDFEVNELKRQSPRILSLWIKGVPAQELLMKMDIGGICLSAGSACSAGALKSSQVIESMYPENLNRGSESLRVSFGRGNTLEDLDSLVRILAKG